MIHVVFTSAPGCVSALIRRITRSRASHVGLRIDADRVIHADGGGVKDDTLVGFLAGGRKILAAYELKQNIAVHGKIERVLAHVGKKYDYEGMVWNAIPLLSWRWFRVKLGNPLADQNEFWCSEFACTALRDFMGPGLATSMIPELRTADAETLTPGNLQRRVSRGTSFVKVQIADRWAPLA